MPDTHSSKIDLIQVLQACCGLMGVSKVKAGLERILKVKNGESGKLEKFPSVGKGVLEEKKSVNFLCLGFCTAWAE